MKPDRSRGRQPASLAPPPAPGIVGAIGPHHDYVYAARVDRRRAPLITAKTGSRDSGEAHAI